MHTIIQLCALLSGQLDEGSEPGTDNWGRLPSLTQSEATAGETATAAAPPPGGGSSPAVPEIVIEEAEDANYQAPERGPLLSATDASVFTNPTTAISFDDTDFATAVSLGQATNVDIDAVLNHESPDVVEAVFLYCLYWSFASPMHLKDQIIIDEAIKALSGLGTVDEGEGMPYVSPGVIPTHSEYLFDYMFDVKEFHWVEWRRLVPKYVHNTAVPYPEIVVPTVETVKLEWLLKEMFLVNFYN